MSYIPRNGSPMNIKHGIKDDSVLPLVRSPIGDPIHKPLIFTFAPRGVDNEAFPCSGDNLLSMFGRRVIDYKSPYATFNTPFLNLFNSLGNDAMVQRVVPADAKVATGRICVEVIAQDVPKYDRGPNNELIYGHDGQPTSSSVIPGIVLAFREVAIDSVNGEFRLGKTADGTLTNDGVLSKVYPLWDVKGPYAGNDVNGFGYKFYGRHRKSKTPLSSDVATQVGARIYGIEFVETLHNVTTPVTWPTLLGADSLSFSFKEGAYYRPMRQNMDYRDLLKQSYRNTAPEIGNLPEYGPFEEFYVYEDNLNLVLAEVAAIVGVGISPDMVDIFQGLDLEGNPYEGLIVNPLDAGETVAFTEQHIHYLSGGSDGTMTNESFDELVRSEMSLFPYGKVQYADELKYSLGMMWDSGFSYDTKEAMVNFISRSKNTHLVLVPFVHNVAPNDIQAEESAKVALAEMLLSAPESARYGTSTVRGALMGQTAKLRNSSYNKVVPAVYTLAAMLSRYAGAAEGYLKTENRFTRGELTVVEDLVEVSMPFKRPETYASDWDVGLIAIRSYDYYRYFIPALSSVYPEDRSVLNNFLFDHVLTYVSRVSDRVWAAFTGESTMTNDEIAAAVSARIIERLAGKLDGVADIVPRAYFTAEDISNGYSITIDLEAYGGVMTTQFNTTIIARRRA